MEPFSEHILNCQTPVLVWLETHAISMTDESRICLFWYKNGGNVVSSQPWNVSIQDTL